MASGYTKGSTSIVVASATGFQVGNIIRFDELDDIPDLGVMSTDGPGRNWSITARITAINGTTISFEPPLPYTFQASLTPRAGYPSSGVTATKLFGAEDFTLNSTATTNAPIKFYGSDRCWLKNIELNGMDNIGAWIANSVQFEMRHCYFHNVHNAPNNADGYGIYLYDGSSYCRVEDNIFSTMSGGVLGSKTSCNAILYNLSRDQVRNNWMKLIESFLSNHGPYGMMSLWEGNIGEQFLDDGYHGSCGYQTLFRNQIHGVHVRGYTENRNLIGLARGAYYYNVVGNVLGDASWNPTAYKMTGQPGYNQAAVIYKLGYPNGWNNDLTSGNWLMYGLTYPDAKVESTLLRHGNYDYFNDAAVWDGGISSHAIPASLLYASKPSYFGSLQWPPIGPDISGLHNDIPAKARWDAYQSSGNKDDLF
jgi:hypothetical protein